MVKHRLKLLLAGALTLLIAAAPAAADNITDVVGDIAIADTAIEPALRGAYADVRFRIENNGTTKIRLTSVETQLGERGVFDVHAGSGSVHSDGFSLGAGEQAKFDKGGARLTLGPLKQDLKEGEIVELTFTFDRWSTVIPVHVHAASQPANGKGESSL